MFTFEQLHFMRRLAVIFISLFFISPARGQEKADTLFFMNGDFLNVQVLDTANFMVHFKYLRKGKLKDLSVERERLFSIRYANGNERIYYYYDTLVGNYFTVEETHKFIYGEHDAINGYKPRLDFAGGFVVGAASAVFTPTIVSPLPVFAFTAAVTLIPRIRGNRKVITNMSYIHDDSYLIGYERIARKKKSFYSLLGGLTGLVVGFGIDLLMGEKIQ
jgi:hypothetical protein